jgi:phage-related protein
VSYRAGLDPPHSGSRDHEINSSNSATSVSVSETAAKSMRGFGGARVMEIVDLHDTNTYRAVYTARFGEAIYVLHAFQKKSKRGIATPAGEIGLIRRRLA